MLSELVSTKEIKKVVCYPWLELQEELHAIFVDNRHPVRSWFRVFGILLATGVGLFLVFNDPAILEFFAGIIKALSFIPEIFQQKAAIALSLLASSSIGAYASKAVIRGFCKFRFGDPDFFLTPKKTKELILKFKEQEIDINAEVIEHVVSFCVHNLREAHHHPSEIGTRPRDWEQILNALIYDADLDLFLEQQAALEAKHKHILEKQELIKSYKLAISSKSSNPPTPPVASSSQQQLMLTEYNRRRSSSVMVQSFNSMNVTNNTLPADERTPLLSRQTSTYSDCPGESQYKSNSPLEQQELLLAKKVVARFKHTHAKKHRIPQQLSEEHLVDQCCKHLEHRACCTNRHILTLKDIELASRRRSTSTTETTAPITPTSPNSMFTTTPVQTPAATRQVSRNFVVESIPDIALQQPSPQSSMYHMPIIPNLIPKLTQ